MTCHPKEEGRGSTAGKTLVVPPPAQPPVTRVKEIKADLSGARTLQSQVPSDPIRAGIAAAHSRSWLEHEVDPGLEPCPVPGNPDGLR